MRVTTGMIANQYGRNLNKSLGQLNYYNNRATTQRRFDRASENPVGAAKAYSLRRSYAQNEDYLLNAEDTENLFQSAHSAKLNISNILQEIGSQDILQGVNGSYAPEDRNIIATKISRLQEAMLTNMNAKYGDKYMFNGGEYKTQPFSLDKSGNLLYRGINVDTGLHVGNQATADIASVDGALIDFGATNSNLLKGYTIEFSTDDVGTNSVDSVGKKIVIGSCATPGAGTIDPMAAADIQTQLQGLSNDGSATGLPTSFDLTAISVNEDFAGTNPPVGAVSVTSGTPATNKTSEAYLGGSIINFGAANGDLLNGYTININKGTPASSSANNDKKVINITIPDVPAPTRADLQAALQGMTGLPAGVDVSEITVSGETTATINFGTAEINGGEPSIAAGTAFDLDELAKETRYIDLGLGVNFDTNNKLDTQTVFDISMPGLAMMGYGVSDDGMPKNIYSLLNKITADLKNPDFSLENSSPLINRFNEQRDKLLYNITDTDSKTTFIKFTKQRLDDTKINLNEKMINVELVDPAEAIMDFKMQQYAYMAALQMGTKIIQPTFLDFMS